jgi:ribosomal 50S subunit-recycling heat shock protein
MSICIPGRMKINGSDDYLDVDISVDDNGKLLLTTDALKYGNGLEIIYDKENQTYKVKGLKQMRKNWKLAHDLVNDPLEQFLYEEVIIK